VGSLRQEREAEQTELGTAWSWNVEFSKNGSYHVITHDISRPCCVRTLFCMRVVLRSVFLGPCCYLLLSEKYHYLYKTGWFFE